MRFILDELSQPWALFNVDRKKFDGQRGVWAVIWALPDLTGRPDAWLELLREWKRLEWTCWHDGLVGWLCGCHVENERMMRWVMALGAQPYAQQPEGEAVLFAKRITEEPKLKAVTMKHLVAAMRPAPERRAYVRT